LLQFDNENLELYLVIWPMVGLDIGFGVSLLVRK